MSLQFIIGPSGSGKSHTVFSDAAAHAEKYPEQVHLVLVPDQFTMHAQRQLVSLSGSNGILNLEALSFERLAYRVFDELGTTTANVLEDTGKSLLLRKIVSDLRDELPVLASGIDKAGFIDELKSLFSEFAQYNISVDALNDFLSAEGMSQSFYYRMEDIKKIYTAYQSALTGAYITAEQILSLLSDVADRSAFLKGAYLAFDGYTGFTPVQNILFKKMLLLADSVRVSVTIDPADESDVSGESGLFFMSRKFIKKMERMAEETGTVTLPDVRFTETGGRRFIQNGMLKHLEANLFRRNPKAFKPGENEKTEDLVSLVVLERQRDELVYVASDIIRRIKQSPTLKFGDFAVLCANIDDYRYYIKDVFSSFDVPVFVDARDIAHGVSFAELVESIVHLYVSDFSYESVIRYLRCGFSPVDREDIDLLENYLLATGLRGRKRLLEIFDRNAKNITPEDIIHLNEIRTMIMDPFACEDIFKPKASVEEYARWLYGIITYIGCEAALWEESDRLWDEDAQEAQRLRQVYPMVMDLLDKMVRLMGEIKVSLEEFEELLKEGLSAIKIGVIPPDTDSVTFGDMERTRVSEIDTLYLIGVSDGRVPGRIEGGGLLTAAERERLVNESKIELAPTIRERALIQRFYIYLALCRPSGQLVLTCPLTGEGDESFGESYLFSMIRDIFPDITTIKPDPLKLAFSCISKQTIAENISDVLRGYMSGALPEEAFGIFTGYLCHLKESEPEMYEKLLSAAAFMYKGSKIKQAVIKAIEGKRLSVSASRLEKYAACAYAYFLKYILQLSEREEDVLGEADLGSIYHETLNRYSRKLKEEGEDWFGITEERMSEILDKSMDEALLGFNDSRISDSARQSYILTRMRRTLHRTVSSLTEQVRKGAFIPGRFEVSLGELSGEPVEYSLSDGSTLRLSGIIDRMDYYEKEDRIYIKILDYKSGNRDISLSDVYEGLSLQLLLYLKAATDAVQKKEGKKKILPAAVFYYQIKDPMVPVKKEPDSKELSEMIAKELRVKGLLCDDEVILTALDKSLEEAKSMNLPLTSLVVPVQMKKDGTLKKGSNVIDSEDFYVLGRFVEKKVIEIGEDILKGKVPAYPYRKKDGSSGCDFCPYHSICGHDTKLGGYAFRKLVEEKDNRAVLDLMKQVI